MNRFMNFLVSIGASPGYMRELQVRGRKSGRVFSTPVNLIEHDGKQWLVAPRGRTQWTMNAEAAGEVVLKRGAKSAPYGVRVTTPEERPLLLKKYLEAFPSQVQRFFKVKAGAPVSEFASVADEHPVYELQPRT
ncbi:MAG TPA: nitroreductase family deazaflavin-dependent oxidoreductase [Polyangiales bacterium]|nr:nitroreductase family deazaflavin-dependent oxidoreductase [Polyangiales bacterium]